MAGLPAERPDSQIWSQLSELAARGSGERELLRAAVEAVAASAGADGVELILQSDSEPRRELAWGVPADRADATVVAVPDGELKLYGAGHRPPPEATAALAMTVHGFRLSRLMARQRFEANYRGVELEALYDVGLAIASTLKLEELTGEILMRAVSLLDARRGALYLAPTPASDELVLLQTLGGEARPSLDLDSPLLTKLLSSENQPSDILPAGRHLLGVAIVVEGRRRGLLVVADKESRQGVGPFAAADRRSLALLANQAAIALENARLHREALEKERLEREAELAADIQRQLLPARVPTAAGFELLGWNRPAREVGGDYYQFLPLGEERLGPVVADVTGKGMPAALLVSTLHSALQLLLERRKVGPDLMRRLNRHIFELSTSNRFITLFVGDLDARSGKLRYLNAGHNPPLLVRSSGKTMRLSVAGMPLGLFADADYRAASVKLKPGDLLCCYSDGITECESSEYEEFGEERLAALVARHHDRALAEIVSEIDRAVVDFCGGSAQVDDQTLILLRRS